MKKMMITALALVLTLSACGKAGPEITEPPTTEAIVETTAETTAPATEAVVETEATEAVTEETEETTAPTEEEPTEPIGVEGYVTARSLNVREEPSINSRKVAQLPKGTRVLIYEEQFLVGMNWGRIDEGWVSLDYISKDAPAKQNPEVQKPSEPSDQNNQESVPSVTIPQNNKPSENRPSENKPTDNKPSGNNPADSIPVNPKPSENKPSENKPSEQTPVDPAPVETKPAEQKPEAPAQCQHSWTPVQNIPAEYNYKYYVVCSCGARFDTADQWSAHQNQYVGTDELLNHSGYSSGSDREKISPAKVLEKCSSCGATRERVIE